MPIPKLSEVQAEELTMSSVMDSLRAGRFYATTGPGIRQIEILDSREIVVRCSPAESIIFYSDSPWANVRALMGQGITEGRYRIQQTDHFVRIEIRDSSGKKAWSSPMKVR